MRHGRTFLAGLWVAAMLCGGAAPDDPDQRAARLIAEVGTTDLPRFFTSRKAPGGPVKDAVAALTQMGDSAVPALSRTLATKESPARLRQNVLYLLERIGTADSLPPRLWALAADPDRNVRAEAASRLPVYADRSAQAAMVTALRDPSSTVRAAAAEALAPRGPRAGGPGKSDPLAVAPDVARLLRDRDPRVRLTAVWTLGKLGSNVVVTDLADLAVSAASPDLRRAAAEAVGEIGDRRVAARLADGMADPEKDVRFQVARALGRLADMRGTPALIGGLRDAEPHIRRDSAAALGQVGDRRAVGPLVAALDDGDEQVRAAAADALGRIGDPAAVGPLCDVIGRHGDVGDTAAVNALGTFGDPRAVGPLVRYARLETPPPGPNHKAAAEALAGIRHPSAVVALVGLATDRRPGASHFRDVLGDATGSSFRHKPPERVEAWWRENKAAYLDAVPAPPP